MIVTLIPAAGASSRMKGKDKLLETIKGVPILRRTAMTALEADLGPVLVTLPDLKGKRLKALRNLDVECLEIPEADEGMSASLRKGAEFASNRIRQHPHDEYSGMLVMLPDMPGIQARDLKTLAESFAASGGAPHRATSDDGVPGHPVLFPDDLLDFSWLRGDQGARAILEEETVWPVPLPGTRAITDLDTPEAWAAWRKATNTPF